MVPPDEIRVVGRPLPDRIEEVADHRKPVVVPARFPTVRLHATFQQSPVVPPEEILLQPRPALWEPKDRHHVGHVAGADRDAPALPVDDAQRVFARIARVEKVTTVGIIVGQRQALSLG